MRGNKVVLVVLLLISLLLSGCEREDTEPTFNGRTTYEKLNRPPYTKDSRLVIGMDSEFSTSFNPFIWNTPGEKIILDVLFTSPLKKNSHNELIPWNGNIVSGSNADGSTSYFVSIDEGMRFTDGTKMDADDFLYALYVKADPSYTGRNPLTELDIRGIWSYYYDDENWKEKIDAIEEKVASLYSIENISQDDFTSYLIETRLEGRFDERTLEEWKEILATGGYGEEVERAETEEQILELASLYEYGENMEDYEPGKWYHEILLSDYIRENIEDGVDVQSISGIERIDERTIRITMDTVDPESLERLNTYIVPRHYYGPFEKGDVSGILEKKIPLGSGAYTFESANEGILVLKANSLYREGIPNISKIVFLTIHEESIIAAIQTSSLDIGLLSGKEEYLEELGHEDIKRDLIPVEGYPSVFLNARTLSREERKALSAEIREIVRYMPISPLEKKLVWAISPLIPEYPRNLVAWDVYQENREIKKDRITILIDQSLPKETLDYLVRDLHVKHNRNGSILETRYLPEDEIVSEMKKGNADAAILPSTGRLKEKAYMYHSESSGNIQGIKDKVIDEILENLMTEFSLDEREKLTSLLALQIEDEALEVPLYQKKAIIAYNTATLDMNSIPDVSTASWNFLSTLWSLRKF